MPRPCYVIKNLHDDKNQVVGRWRGLVYWDINSVFRWLKKRQVKLDIETVSKAKSLIPISILRNVDVELAYRGRGFGDMAMEEFIAWSQKKKCVYSMLEADADRMQRKGFDLVKWYEKWGFAVVGTCYSGEHCIMIREL